MRKKGMIRYVSVMAVIASLTGCANMAVTGAQAVYNRHSIEKDFKDQHITMQAFKALKINDKRFKNSHIAIATFNQEVLLAGQVPEPWQAKEAQTIVSSIPDIKHVYNLLEVAGPSSTIKKMSDSWITAKVKAKIIASDDVDATKVKVVTENGTVYLMGVLKKEEADEAVKLASFTDGVERVVKVFSYVKIYKEHG